MIRPFKIEDFDGFEGNQFSDVKLYREKFDSETLIKYSFEIDGKVLAIVAFVPYWGKNYYGSFLISKDFKHPVKLRTSLFCLIEAFGADRIETDSIDCDKLNKWHKFLGFKHVGKKTRYAFGLDFNTWEWLRNGN